MEPPNRAASEGFIMWLKSILLCITIYLPIFGQALGFLPKSMTTFFICFAVAMVAWFGWFLSFKYNRIFSDARPLVIFNVLLILINFSHFLMANSDFKDFLSIIQGYLVSLLILMYFVSNDSEGNIKVIEGLFVLVGFMFLVQLGLSMYESKQGYYLYTIPEDKSSMLAEMADLIESRIVLSMIPGAGFSGYFNLPFSGMLGQWNFWGTQLPFYNLIFLFLWHLKDNRFYLILSLLTLFAAIYNTSRFGISAIVFTDIVFMIWVHHNYTRTVYFCIVSATLFVCYKFSTIINILDTYFARADTLTGRLFLYDMFYNKLFEQDILEVLFGLGCKRAQVIAGQITGISNSFESEIFSKIYFSGLISAILFLNLLIQMWRQSYQLGPPYKYINILIVINIIAVSLISNLVFIYYIYALVTLIYLYNLLLAKRHNVTYLSDAKL